jgi:hypothetical protein
VQKHAGFVDKPQLIWYPPTSFRIVGWMRNAIGRPLGRPNAALLLVWPNTLLICNALKQNTLFALWHGKA